MYIISIDNYKRKLLFLFLMLVLLILIIIGTGLLINNAVKYTVNFNDNISISYPATYTISNVYSKADNSAPYLQASNTSYKSYINYKSIDEGIEFSYPSIFKINSKTFPGSEIVFHLDFQNKKEKLKSGFVQVWNLPYSLEKFLENSKQTAMEDFINFSSKKIKVNNLEGYFWEYDVSRASGNYKALEVFLSKGSKMYRISYFIPEKLYGKDEYEMYWKMVDSLKIK